VIEYAGSRIYPLSPVRWFTRSLPARSALARSRRELDALLTAPEEILTDIGVTRDEVRHQRRALKAADFR